MALVPLLNSPPSLISCSPGDTNVLLHNNNDSTNSNNELSTSYNSNNDNENKLWSWMKVQKDLMM